MPVIIFLILNDPFLLVISFNLLSITLTVSFNAHFLLDCTAKLSGFLLLVDGKTISSSFNSSNHLDFSQIFNSLSHAGTPCV